SDITFKKVKRSIRVKQPAVVLPKPSSLADGSDSDNDSEKDPPATAAPSNSKSNSSKHQQAKSSKSADVPTLTASASALSFQDDLIADGGEEFRVKKSSNSRKLAKRQRLRYDKEAAAAASAAYPGNSGGAGPGSSAADEIQEVEMEDDYPVSVQQLRSQIASQGIPDSRTVYQLKLQRQLAARARRANQAGASDDDSPGRPADDDTNSGFGGGDDSDVADVLDDDNGDGSGGGVRVRLLGTLRPEAERRMMRDQFLAAEHGSPPRSFLNERSANDNYDDDYDDDDGFPGGGGSESYERQQLRRAANLAGPATLAAVGDVVEGSSGSAGAGGGEGGGIFTRLPSALGVAYADLRERIDADRRRLVELADNETDRLTTARRELADCQDRLAEREARLPKLEAAYRDLASLRSHLADYADCMSEKLVQVELLERRLLSALAERSQRQIRRRRQDVRDESSAARGEDEALIRRVAEREARRTRRRRQRELNGTDAAHDSGESTDDEETSAERMGRESAIDQVRHVQESQLFSDVLPEFCTLESLLSRLSEFRSSQPDLYERARFPACMARLLSPLVRVEMLLYNPLTPDCVELNRRAWLGHVLDYLDLDSHPDEVKVVPGLVELVLLPRLIDIVEQIWDPMSSSESKRLSSLLASLAREFPTFHAGSARTQRLCLAVHDRLSEFVAKEPFIPLMMPKPAESTFYNRQLVQAIKLFTNVLRFSELLSPTTLHKLSADCLLSRYILVGLGNLPVTDRLVSRLDAILSALPAGFQLPKPFAELVKRIIASANNSPAPASASSTAFGLGGGLVSGSGGSGGLSLASRLALQKLSSLYWVSQ
uniref:GCFC domain-containing protein n=2 Tax=Macrostomum lignano TaxID=282301 RepID=A0A1I8GHZ5_9PLAT